MESTRAQQRLGHVRALDGVRGIAVLLVLLNHAYHWPHGGFLGVDIFFVLSGFLITTLLLQEQAHHGRISLRAFYRRRWLRLAPALALVLTAYAGASLAVALGAEPSSEHSLSQSLLGIVSGAFYVSNVVQAWHGLLPGAIRHLWSLATEEQFYLAWPLTLVFVLRHRRSPRALAVVLGSAIASVAVLRFALDVGGVGTRHLYFAPETTFDSILVGCLFGVWLVHGTGPERLRAARFRRFARPVAVVLLALPILLVQDWTVRGLYSVVELPFAVATGFLLFCFVIDGGSLAPRALSVRPLGFLGKISYGLYLWHPVLLWSTGYFTPTEAVVLSIGAATASYYLVERRFLARRYAEAPVARRLPPRLAVAAEAKAG